MKMASNFFFFLIIQTYTNYYTVKSYDNAKMKKAPASYYIIKTTHLNHCDHFRITGRGVTRVIVSGVEGFSGLARNVSAHVDFPLSHGTVMGHREHNFPWPIFVCGCQTAIQARYNFVVA